MILPTYRCDCCGCLLGECIHDDCSECGGRLPNPLVEFYGYTLRPTTDKDLPLAIAGSAIALTAGFWLRQGEGRETFIVFERREYPLAFFQTEHVAQGDQVRLHWLPMPDASPKRLLRALTRLVPLIEKGLALRGVRAIFFTSHSSAMTKFMEKRLGYSYAGNGGCDGVMMAKGLTR